MTTPKTSFTVNTDGTMNILSEIISVTGTSKTLAITDANSIQSCSNAATQTISIPADSSVSFDIGTVIQFDQIGTGGLTVASVTGVLLNGALQGAASISKQFSSFFVRKQDTDTWVAQGSAETNSRIRSIDITFDGGASAIPTGVTRDVYIPYNCSINGWTLASPQTGNLVIDIWATSYGSFPATVSNSIAGSEKPTLSGANHNQDLTLTTWSSSVSGGTMLRFNVDSVSGVSRANLTIQALTV